MGMLRTPVLLLLVALVATGALEPLAPHTDDGCRTEIHCQACRHGLASLAVVDGLAEAGPHLRLEDAVVPARQAGHERLGAPSHLVRGPPSSS